MKAGSSHRAWYALALSTVLTAACSSAVAPGDGSAGDATTSVDTWLETGCQLPNGSTCAEGSECPAGDNCNTCTCAQGVLSCTHQSCSPPDSTTNTDASDVNDVIDVTDVIDAVETSDSGAPNVCRTSADCPPDRVCVYGPGCATGVVGTCAAVLPCTEPSDYCGCDMHTFSACQPTQLFASVGACPTVPPDAGVTRYPTARMDWQAPGGFAGSGPAIIVTGDGRIRVWNQISGIAEPSMPSTPPDQTLVVLPSDIDALFDAWSTTPSATLPHPNGGGGECYPSVYVQTCATCTTYTRSYRAPQNLLPEMDAVWNWFDHFLGGASPRNYCG